MIGEANENPQRKKSLTWNFFKKLDQTHAKCNLCHGIYKYQFTRSHLLKHVKKQHTEALLEFKNQEKALEQEINNSPLAFTDEISMTSWPAVEVLLQTEESQSGEKSADEEQSSHTDIWDMFTRMDDTFAECNLCQVKLHYKDSISDLTKHRKFKHSEVFCQVKLRCKDSISDSTKHRKFKHSEVLFKCNSSEDEPSRNGSSDILDEGNCSQTHSSSKDSSPNEESKEEISEEGNEIRKNIPDVLSSKLKESAAITLANERHMKMQKSPAGQYFTSIDENQAQCKICQATISLKHRGSFYNLMRHIIRKHPCELVARARNGEKKDAEKNVDDIVDEDALPPTISDVKEEPEEVNKIRKDTPDVPSSDETSEFRRSKRTKRDYSLHEEDPVKKTKLKDVSMNANLQPSQDQNSVLGDNTVTGKNRKKKVIGAKKRVGFRSSVWKNFIKLENGCSWCKICGTTMSKNSYTSNLLRHMKRVHSTIQRKSSEEEVSIQRPPVTHRETGPIIHTFEKATKSISTQYDQPTEEPQTACSSSDTVGCLLSERLVHAVEEGNHLLRNLHSAVERQGDALSRLVACLEGMNQAQNNNQGSHSS